MSRIEQPIKLLPNYFKHIGLGIFLLTSALFIFTPKFYPSAQEGTEDIYKTIVINIIILSLLVIALSKDMIEDELIMNLRLRAMASSFIFITILAIIDPFFDLSFGNTLEFDSGREIIIQMLFLYHLTFWTLKMKR